jgi:hypothetical protein
MVWDCRREKTGEAPGVVLASAVVTGVASGFAGCDVQSSRSRRL